MPPQQNLAIPIAIVVAGVLIAGALFFAGRAPSPADPRSEGGGVTNIPSVMAADHILGDPNAPIIVVEYVDFECPFCKQFHATMQSIMDIYGKDGRVAWVMRNFPLVQIHPNAPKIAEAAECVAEELGNAAYWKFISEMFIVAPSGVFFPMDRLSELAVKVGANADTFEECVAKDAHRDLIARQFNDALAAGGTGTPYNVILTAGGEVIPISGAQPFSTMKSVIDSILAGGAAGG